MTENAVSAEWAATVQLEQCKAAKISAIMQAITAVPLFEGASSNLEFFLKRMDIIAQQVTANQMDEATNKYILGYFFSRMTLPVLQDIGASCDTSWDEVKTNLREKYGGSARSIPKLIIREVLVARESGESAATYAKSVLKGVRKIRNRMKDATTNEREAEIRIQLMEELATEVVMQNLPRRVRQWVKIVKPETFETLVKTVEDDEADEKEERWEDSKRKVVHSGRGNNDERKLAIRDGWQKVQYRQKDYRPPARIRPQLTNGARKEREYRPSLGRNKGFTKPQGGRQLECWECKEPGHFARECPYIFRREQRRTGGNNFRDEPMEVNMTRATRYRSDSGSDSDTSTSSSQRSRGTTSSTKRRFNQIERKGEEKWPTLPPRNSETARWNITKRN